METVSAAGGRQIRLDKFLSDRLKEFSRTTIQKMILDGLVLVNDSNAKPSLKLEGTESIKYTYPAVEEVLNSIKPSQFP